MASLIVLGCFTLPNPFNLALGCTMLAQWGLYSMRNHFQTESYRIMADAALFIGPIALLAA
jgi:hypothetical protein